jgi:small neutral amino acid transporter SnatA (MarC family)
MDWRLVLEELTSTRLLLPFIPLFVAFDVLGILPLYVTFTMEMTPHERRKVVRQSLMTAFLSAPVF